MHNKQTHPTQKKLKNAKYNAQTKKNFYVAYLSDVICITQFIVNFYPDQLVSKANLTLAPNPMP